MRTQPFSEPRAHLTDAFRSVETGNELFSISRRRQVAGFAERLGRWRTMCLTSDTAVPDDDPFANARQADSGREFCW